MRNWEIYKMWKHGDSMKHHGLTPKRVYNALKTEGLQVVLVEGESGPIVYNYVPEEDKFYHVYE